MPQEIDQPLSNPAVHPTQSVPHESQQRPSLIRIRQGRYEGPFSKAFISEPGQQIGSGLRRPTNPSGLITPHQSDESHQSPAPRRPPAYLQGKNPYGQLLERVEHPYWVAKAPTGTIDAPYQADFNLVSRPDLEPFGSKQAVLISGTTSPPTPTGPTPKQLSVQATRRFFETKSAECPSAPLSQLSRTVSDSKGWPVQKQRSDVPGHEQGLQGRSSQRVQTSRSSSQSQHIDQSHHADAVTLSTSEPPCLHIDEMQPVTGSRPDLSGKCRKVAGTSGHPISADCSKNPIETSEQLSIGHQTDVDYSTIDDCPKLSALSLQTSVRSQSPEKLEKQLKQPIVHKFSTAARGKDVVLIDQATRKKNIESLDLVGELENTTRSMVELPSKRTRRGESRSTPVFRKMTDMGLYEGHHLRRNLTHSSMEEGSKYVGTSQNSPSIRQRAERFAMAGLSHDGSGPHSDLVTHGADCVFFDPDDSGTWGEEMDIPVPDHVDSRSAYGRRRTQDFGYPGAHVKLGGTDRVDRPVQYLERWAEYADEHFACIDGNDVQEHTGKT